MYKSSKTRTVKTQKSYFVFQSKFIRDCDTVLNYQDNDENKAFHNIFANILESIMDR